MTEQEQDRARALFLAELEGKSFEELTEIANELLVSAREESVDDWSKFLNANHRHLIVMRILAERYQELVKEVEELTYEKHIGVYVVEESKHE